MNDKIAREALWNDLISDSLPFGRLWYSEPSNFVIKKLPPPTPTV
jgi:hypothetical protein